MTDLLKVKPKKGILKSSSSFEAQEKERQEQACKETKWDEMNILATLHPKDKDYGHMKIEEPKTPYNYMEPDQDRLDGVDADALSERIQASCNEPPKAFNEPEEESSDEDETVESQSKRMAFESKRKIHYNEFQAVKIARQLMEQDSEDEDEIGEKHITGTIPEESEEMDENGSATSTTKGED